MCLSGILPLSTTIVFILCSSQAILNGVSTENAPKGLRIVTQHFMVMLKSGNSIQIPGVGCRCSELSMVIALIPASNTKKEVVSHNNTSKAAMHAV